MGFKFITKSNGRGGGASKGALVRIKRVKDRINFTLYKDFSDVFGFKRGDTIDIGVDGKRIAFVKNDNGRGYVLSSNGAKDGDNLRFSIRSEAFDFVTGDVAVFIYEKHIDFDNDMVIIDYGKALFEIKSKGLV